MAELSSATTQVERPQNGERSHVLPGSTVEQRVEAKHIPGKSEQKTNPELRSHIQKFLNLGYNLH